MIKQQSLRIIPLGGLGEVGRNMMLVEYNGAILIIDMGFRMPSEDMPGIDYIIPNINYLKGKEKNITGIVFTHGHYDHIGAVPYIVEKLGGNKIPIFASALARGIIMRRQEEFTHQPKLDITEVKSGSKIKLGPFNIEFFQQNHSIPDNLGLIIQTHLGNIVHTSDFLFDPHPINDKPTDFNKLKSIGARKVLLLMSDSTGAEELGHSLSEKTILKNLDEIFQQSKGKIIAATFASLINRMQQIIHLSEKYNRKVILQGYSMKANVEISKQLGHLKTKKGTLIKAKSLKDYPDSRITVLCTGAQGEGRAVQTVKDGILRQGAKVFHYKMMDIHVGGHGKQDELSEMIKIMRPRFFLPIHGQVSMMVAHADLAKSIGMPERNVIMAENGQIIHLTPNKISIGKRNVRSNYVMVDGLGVGDIGEVVLRDRQMLAKDGMFVIVAIVDREKGKINGSPDIISRGFVYLRESKPLLAETRKKVINIVNTTAGNNKAINKTYIKDEIRNKIGEFLYIKTRRRPIVLPVVIEV